jgi:hypothetical protein
MPIEQVYCTHCTYGTSALEQREGELADRVLGYSARAGSAERNELRNDYRAIERFLYYYLPSDTPPEEKQRLDAAAAPRRLFFCPSMGRLQMVGQVAYRQYDTAGRLGSYFAHVLFADRAGGGWSVVDCLRLWDAPWITEDSPNHPFKLSSLARLDEVWAGVPPAIGDDALWQFLQPSLPAGGDNAGLLAGSRWQDAPAQQRIDLLANTLQGLLALGAQRRENVLLVVEPSIAALVFYGVARLLPKSLAEGLSFSTYEPNAERLPVTLAATTFFDPQTTDIRTDLYRRRGLVINTYQDRISEGGVPPGKYARFMIEQLLEEGWPTVDRLRGAFEAAGAKRPEDLEVLVPTHHLASQVLSASRPEDDSWRKSDLAARYLAREVQHQLATPPENGLRLSRVLGTPNHLTVLELITCEPPVAGLQRPAQLLLREFPAERIGELVASPLLARGAKLEALVGYATSQGRLPDGCQLLGEAAPASKTRSSAGDGLLPDLLARLPEAVLRRVCEALEETQRPDLLPALVAACRQPAATAALKRLLLEILTQLDDRAFFDALMKYRREIGEGYPPPQPEFAGRLGRALYELPDHPKDFETRLTVLETWKSYFFYPNLAEQRLGEWKKVRSCLVELDEREQKATAGRLERLKQRLRPPRPPDFKPLGEALARAMPKRNSELAELAEVAGNCGLDVGQFKARLELASRHLSCPMTFQREPGVDTKTIRNAGASGPQAELEQLQRRREQQARLSQLLRELEERLLIYGDDASGKRKLQVVQRIAQTLLNRSPLTLKGKQEIEIYFEHGLWPTAGALSTGKGKRRFKLKHPSKPTKQPSWTTVAGVGVLVALLVPLVGYFVFGGRTTPVATNRGTSHPPSTAKKTVDDGPSQPVEATSSEEVDHEPDDEASSAEMSDRGPEETPTKPSADEDAPSSVAGKNGRAANGPDKKPTVATAPDREEAAPAASAETTEMAAPVTASTTTPPSPTVPPATTPDGEARSLPADADTVDPPAEAPARIVDEYRALPQPNGRSTDLMQDLNLDTSPAESGEIKLALHGLRSANEWLKQHHGRELVASRQGQALQVAALQVAAEGEDKEQALARFAVKENNVVFQWVAADGPPPPSACYTALRRCVLEAAGDSKSTFVSLSKPIVTEEQPFKNGTLTCDVRQFGTTDLEPAAGDELFLGFGSIEVENDRRVQFGDATSANVRAGIRDLPNHYGKSEAQVELARSADGRESKWLIRITAKKDGPAGLARLPLRTLREKIRALASSDLDTVDAAAKALAADLNLKAPAVPEGDQKSKETAAYRNAIKKDLLPPARERESRLMQLESLREHALKMSAVIYRRVNRTTFARYLVMGHPEPPEASEDATDDPPTENN